MQTLEKMDCELRLFPMSFDSLNVSRKKHGMLVEYDEKFVYAVCKAIEFAIRKLPQNKKFYHDLHLLYSLEAGDALTDDKFERRVASSCQEAFERWKENDHNTYDCDFFEEYSGIMWDAVRKTAEKVADVAVADRRRTCLPENFVISANPDIKIDDAWLEDFGKRCGFGADLDNCLNFLGHNVLKALGVDGANTWEEFVDKACGHWIDYASGQQVKFVIGDIARTGNSCLMDDGDSITRTMPWWNGKVFVRRNLPPFSDGKNTGGVLDGREKISSWIICHARCLQIVSSEISRRSGRWLLLVRRVLQQLDSRFHKKTVSFKKLSDGFSQLMPISFDATLESNDWFQLIQIATVILARRLEDMLYAKANKDNSEDADLWNNPESVADSLFGVGSEAIGGSIVRLTSGRWIDPCVNLTGESECGRHFIRTLRALFEWVRSAEKNGGKGHAVAFCGMQERRVYDMAFIVKSWLEMCDEVNRTCNQSASSFLVEEFWKEKSGIYDGGRGKPCDIILEKGPEADVNSIRSLVMERRKKTLYARLWRRSNRSMDGNDYYDAIEKQVGRALGRAYGFLYLLDGLGNAFDGRFVRDKEIDSADCGNWLDEYVIRKLKLLGNHSVGKDAFCCAVWKNAICLPAVTAMKDSGPRAPVTFDSAICRWCLDMSVIERVWDGKEPGRRILGGGRAKREEQMLVTLGLADVGAEELMERDFKALHRCEHEVARYLLNNSEVACCEAKRKSSLCMETR